MDIKSDEYPYTPQYIKDIMLQNEIDKLLRRPWLPEEEKYSLEPRSKRQNESNGSHKRKLTTQTQSLRNEPVKTSIAEVDKNTKAKTLAELYVAGILLKTGAEVSLMHTGVGYDMLVLTAENRIERLNVIADRDVNSRYVGIETMRTVNGETVMDIDNTLADHYLIKICGTPGVYQVTTNKLKQILKAHGQKKITVPCEAGHYEVIPIDRKILLANCAGLNL